MADGSLIGSRPDYVRAMINIAMEYEQLNCLKVGGVEIYKNLPEPKFSLPTQGQLDDVYPEPPSYDDLTKDYVESTEGPNDD